MHANCSDAQGQIQGAPVSSLGKQRDSPWAIQKQIAMFLGSHRQISAPLITPLVPGGAKAVGLSPRIRGDPPNPRKSTLKLLTFNAVGSDTPQRAAVVQRSRNAPSLSEV